MKQKDNFWIPYADLMTVLMIVFLFIAVAYMALIQIQKKKQDKLFTDYEVIKQNLKKELDSNFYLEKKNWNFQINSDLSIKFTNPEVLFDEGKYEIKPSFKNILDSFIPKYLNIILQEKYNHKISEVRIEGHTDTSPINKTTDNYIDNMELSQNRARAVLAYIRSLQYFKNLNAIKQNTLQFWLTANGLSFGRTVDLNDSLTYFTQNKIDKQKSRRVEFKIVTTSEQLIEEVLKELK